MSCPLTLGLEVQVCFELRLLDLACLVIPSRPPLFWERGFVLLLVDALGLSLLKEYCQVWVPKMVYGLSCLCELKLAFHCVLWEE
jgi:hypothetical protein